ncbi:MAG: RDD family protein [Cyanobacteria bacterium P01_F01_bin.42]
MPRNPQHQMPIADLRRRVGAAAIDFILVWLTSALIGSSLGGAAFVYWVVFLGGWYALRVFIVLNNQGQSPGHWALDMKVVEEYSGRMPRQEWLLRREGAVGFVCSLFLVGLQGQNLGSLIFVLALPLGVDFWMGSTDRRLRQTLHDRWGRTVVINTARGYSLDLKLTRRLNEFRDRQWPQISQRASREARRFSDRD